MKTTTVKNKIEEGYLIEHSKHGEGIVKGVQRSGNRIISIDVSFVLYGGYHCPQSIRKVFVNEELFSVVQTEKEEATIRLTHKPWE